MFVFIPIAFVIAIFLIWRYSKPSMKGCRWRMDHARDQDGKTFFHCAACGASHLSETGKAPDFCATRKG